MTIKAITIADSDNSQTLVGTVGSLAETGVFASSLQGWYSTPELKVNQTESQTGNGAFDVPEQDVLYAARTVTIGVTIRAAGREEVISLMNTLLVFANRIVAVTVKDSDTETFSSGYLKIDFDKSVNDMGATGTITVVCADPRRLSTTEKSIFMSPNGSSSDGLVFTDNGNISLPISFGGSTNVIDKGTLVNSGTSTAYPIITVSGDMQDFSVTNISNDKQLVYSGVISWNPLVMDCKSQTANIGGVDVTRNLSKRDFPRIKPGESLTLIFLATGTGTMTVSIRDTYI